MSNSYHKVRMAIRLCAQFANRYLVATRTFPFQPEDSDDDWALVGKHSIGYAGPITISRDIPANTTSGQIFHGPLVVANV